MHRLAFFSVDATVFWASYSEVHKLRLMYVALSKLSQELYMLRLFLGLGKLQETRCESAYKAMPTGPESLTSLYDALCSWLGLYGA